MDRIICIMGPTATGKSKLAVALAKKLNGEVISCDSMQIYRGMDIGTAKVTPEEMQGVVHHMIDVAEPWEDYSVSRFCEAAKPIVDRLLAENKTVLLAGGTGQYMDALISGHSFAPYPSTGKREALEGFAEENGIEALWNRLKEVDPASAQRLPLGDKRRIIRALEIYEETGQTMTEHDRLTRLRPKDYHPFYLALTYENRADLYEKIDLRVDEMVKRGLEQEVSQLLDRGVPETATGMQAIGYKEFLALRRGEATRQQTLEKIKQGSRNYAKRQLTWLKRNKEISYISLPAHPEFPEVFAQAMEILRAKGFFDYFPQTPTLTK